ncbi:PPOX class F420-dependent oxidoreductase [Streptomyces sp. NBC_00250]|uniref:PPOX class F420-dependent oxidoreductase n=1 Tax=Streptomyces sp. NBC_00250 TaxID=2903641 RepID=UPI002E29E52D|nr:PPOX class F420-dependent oxidoreductase [Streptomyces sp. NBC_00250]
MRTETVAIDADSLAFWAERHLCTLTTLRTDGRPHVVPVGVTLDAELGVARVITRKSSKKVANVLSSPTGEARVAVCQVDGGRWATLEGVAEIRIHPDVVGDAVTRYADRYGRTPTFDPERVVIEIRIDRAMGQAKLPQTPAGARTAG